ncbi:hypothetical protein [Methyloterricola oryzae]|uniref:hypothetical protein n=1 Tax=Methyloterricola oryzae TaxID=1495050 RepID=UPI0005EB04FD|nr:hypothetical protein [Methyloterricola oryzae]
MFALAATMAGSNAFAHDEITTQITEGETADITLAINHGCETPTGGVNAIVAQSVVFPGADISSIEQGNLAGLVDTVSPNLFPNQAEKLDSLGNALGFSGRGATLQTISRGRVKFAFTAPNFVAESCVKKLNVVLVVADICQNNNPKIRPGKVNIWMPALTGGPSTGIVAQAAANGIDGYGTDEPATLTINRDLSANPLDPSCGDGTEETVSPTTAEVNAKLPIPGFW